MTVKRMRQEKEITLKTSLPTVLFRVFIYFSLTLSLIPVQILALMLRLPLSQRLPMWYHRLCCRILGIRLEVFGRRARVRPT